MVGGILEQFTFKVLFSCEHDQLPKIIEEIVTTYVVARRVGQRALALVSKRWLS